MPPCPPDVACVAAPAPTPLDGLGDDLAAAFTGTSLLWYGAAVAGTAAMAYGGADQAIRVGVQQHLASSTVGHVADVSGYLVPVVAPAVWLVGVALGDREAAGVGSAAVQALGVTLATTGLLKLGVGRSYPLRGGDPAAPDRLDHPEYAHDFAPFQQGWPLPAWPSGHTAATTSVVASFTGYSPERWWIPAAGYPVALAIGFGLIEGDSHWASDVLGGALIGHAIGYAIGRQFRLRARGQEPAVTLVPVPGGVGVGGAW